MRTKTRPSFQESKTFAFDNRETQFDLTDWYSKVRPRKARLDMQIQFELAYFISI
jgi:hypothetical protein